MSTMGPVSMSHVHNTMHASSSQAPPFVFYSRYSNSAASKRPGLLRSSPRTALSGVRRVPVPTLPSFLEEIDSFEDQSTITIEHRNSAFPSSLPTAPSLYRTTTPAKLLPSAVSPSKVAAVHLEGSERSGIDGKSRSKLVAGLLLNRGAKPLRRRPLLMVNGEVKKQQYVRSGLSNMVCASDS